MENFNAYVHARPDGRVFYVGKGTIKRANNVRRGQNLHHSNIVEKYGRENILVGRIPCSSEEIAFELEKGLVKCFRRMGIALANATDGGEGASGAKWSAAQRLAKSEQAKSIIQQKKLAGTYSHNRPGGWVTSDETKKKISAALKGHPGSLGRLGAKNSPEHNAALRKANLGRKMSDEARANMSAGALGRKASEETKQKMSEAHRRIWAQRKLEKEQRA